MFSFTLQESETLPTDFTRLFDDVLFKFDTNLIPESVSLYEVRICALFHPRSNSVEIRY